MNVLARCWVATHPLTERAEVFTTESSDLQKFRDMESWTVTEYVPAATAEGAVKTLERIREHAGAVCATYETCEHPACQASYAAWTLADEYLQRGQSGDVRCTDCGTTRALAVIDCPGCDVPRGHVHKETEETR